MVTNGTKAAYNGLLTEDPKDMQNYLDVVNEFCEATGMRLNVKKSAGYDIKPCANRSYLNNDVHPKWEVDGQELPLIAPADGTKYLGVKVNSWTGVTKENTGEKLELAPLKPRQKLVMLNQYAIGRLQFYLSQVETPQCKLLEMDQTVRRFAKRWLKLPECATDHILCVETKKGGLSLSLSVPCSRINIKRAIHNSSDKNIRSFAIATDLPEEIAREAEHFKIQIPESVKRGAKWRQLETNRWRNLPVAGKGHRAFSFKWSNSWLKTDHNYVEEGDFITGLKLRTDTYPTRVALARAGNTGDTTCRRCRSAPETIGHISGQCPAMIGHRITRHDGICGIVSDRLKSKGWTVAQEPRLVDVDGNTLIPDIVAIRDQRAVIIDPTIVYENTPLSE
jgi:hypothetical protein